ncbi:MAG: hypothetical protein KDK50_02935 [Chlamydiia bacterium]|nr:hypothetical protein [Chlamydiia bacterium]
MTSEISSQSGSYLSRVIESASQYVDRNVSRPLFYAGLFAGTITLSFTVAGNRMGIISDRTSRRVLRRAAIGLGLIGANRAGLISGRSVALIAVSSSVAYYAGSNQTRSIQESIQEANSSLEQAQGAIGRLQKEVDGAHELKNRTEDFLSEIEFLRKIIEQQKQLKVEGLSTYRLEQIIAAAEKINAFSEQIATSTHDELVETSKSLCEELKTVLQNIRVGEVNG